MRPSIEPRLRADLRTMSPKLKEVAVYCLAHAPRLHTFRIQAIADECHTQPVTIVRLAKRYGYRGFMDFKMAFLEQGSPATDVPCSVVDQCRLAMSQQGTDASQQAYSWAADLLQQARTVWILCAHETAPIAQCYAELLRLTGLTVQWPNPEQHPSSWEWQIGKQDVILSVALQSQEVACRNAVFLAERQRVALVTVSDKLRGDAAGIHLHVANLGQGMQGISSAIVLAQAVHVARKAASGQVFPTLQPQPVPC